MRKRTKPVKRAEIINGIINRLKNEIMYTWTTGINHMHSSDRISTSLQLRVWDNNDFKLLPKMYQNQLRTYSAALSDYVWREKLWWVHWYDGKFVADKLPYGEGFEQKKIDKSRHCWKGTETIYYEPENQKL